MSDLCSNPTSCSEIFVIVVGFVVFVDDDDDSIGNADYFCLHQARMAEKLRRWTYGCICS